MISRKPVFLFVGLFFSILLSFNSYASDADRVKQLIDVIRNGPSLYRTQEAAAAVARFKPQGSDAPSVSDQASLAAIKRCIRAAIDLGDLGPAAKEAVPALIEMFPQAEHVALISNAQYGHGMGQFEDWIQTYVISAKNKFLLSSPFIEYQTLRKCEEFVEATAFTDIHNKRMSGGRIVEAFTDIYVLLRVNAAGCALSGITGISPGTTPEAWRGWYASIHVSAAPAPTTPSLPPSKVTFVTTSANPPLDYVEGGRYIIRLSTTDVVVGTVEAVDDASITVRTDNGGRYIYGKSFIRDKTLISVPYGAQPAPAAQAAPSAQQQGWPGSIPYEKLLDLSYSGKEMKVMLQNGTVLRGTLGVVDASILRLNVDGVEMPVSRGVIFSVSLVPDSAEVKPADKPAGASDGTSPW
jgi:hypothetical protein